LIDKFSTMPRRFLLPFFGRPFSWRVFLFWSFVGRPVVAHRLTGMAKIN
jgi:hypothetical protein